MSYQLKVIKDYPIGFWPLDEISGTSAQDISGCGNNGTYSGGITTGLIPLVSGGNNGSLITKTKYISLPITKDYYGSNADGGFADYNSSDNDFSLEIWIYPKINSSALTPIFADTVANTGIFYQSGNIVFILEGTRLDYTLPNIEQSHHIIATYTKSQMSLYIDGLFVGKKELDGFKFSSESVELKIGPTSNTSDSFIVDAPAVYRYAIDQNKANQHYTYSGVTLPLHVAYPEGGVAFDIFDDGSNRQFTFTYPGNRPWEYFLTEDLDYNLEEKYLSIKKTDVAASKSVVIYDAIAIPAGFDLDASKIEWKGDNGVSIRSSIDEANWSYCINGMSIPQFSLNNNSFSSERILYLEITLDSSDSSKYNPKLYSLILCFYNDQTFYSLNSSDRIVPISSATTKEIALGNRSMPALSRHKLNGLKTGNGSGFAIETQDQVSSIEMFVTLDSISSNTLVSTDLVGDFVASSYSWNSGGTIAKTNISAIYVNGINKISETSISQVFLEKELYHVVVVFAQPATMPKFNISGPVALYQYILYYQNQLSASNSQAHYNMHIGRPSAVADDSLITLTENSVNFYNNDWVVLQNK